MARVFLVGTNIFLWINNSISKKIGDIPRNKYGFGWRYYGRARSRKRHWETVEESFRAFKKANGFTRQKPNVYLNHGDYVSPEFRNEFNRWLRQFFGVYWSDY